MSFAIPEEEFPYVKEQIIQRLMQEYAELEVFSRAAKRVTGHHVVWRRLEQQLLQRAQRIIQLLDRAETNVHYLVSTQDLTRSSMRKTKS